MNCSISEPNGILLSNKQEYLDKLLDQFRDPKKDILVETMALLLSNRVLCSKGCTGED